MVKFLDSHPYYGSSFATLTKYNKNPKPMLEVPSCYKTPWSKKILLTLTNAWASVSGLRLCSREFYFSWSNSCPSNTKCYSILMFAVDSFQTTQCSISLGGSLNITLHNSLIVFDGTMYHMSMILLWCRNSPFMGAFMLCTMHFLTNMCKL